MSRRHRLRRQVLLNNVLANSASIRALQPALNSDRSPDSKSPSLLPSICKGIAHSGTEWNSAFMELSCDGVLSCDAYYGPHFYGQSERREDFRLQKIESYQALGTGLFSLPGSDPLLGLAPIGSSIPPPSGLGNPKCPKSCFTIRFLTSKNSTVSGRYC